MIISSEKFINKSKGWIDFGVKRIIRIVPIYWTVTSYKILVMIFASRLVLHSALNWGFIFKSFFFIPALNKEGMINPFYGVGWTLNYEMFFYLLFTISLAIRVRPLLFLSLILIPLSIISIFKDPSWSEIINFYANPIILNFLYGMIIAKLILNDIKLPPIPAVILMFIGFIILFFPTGIFSFIRYFSFNKIAVNIATIFIIYGGASLETILGKKVSNILIFLGAASYSLYLVHPSVAPLAPTVLKLLHLKIIWLSVLLAMVSSIIMAILFYLFCEKPITKFLNNISRKKKLAPGKVT